MHRYVYFFSFEFRFQADNGLPIILTGKKGYQILSKDFPTISAKYNYTISALISTIFETKNRIVIYEGVVIFGDREAVIFHNKILRIASILEERNSIAIKPVFVDEIQYMGVESLSYTDLAGDYAHYTGNLYFQTQHGNIYFKELNPVDLYLVNEQAGLLHISFDEGNGLLIDQKGISGFELYKHIDPPPKLASHFSFPDFFEFTYHL